MLGIEEMSEMAEMSKLELVEMGNGVDEKVQNDLEKKMENEIEDEHEDLEISTQDESKQLKKRREMQIPEGMSKKLWKKEQKRLRWEEQKEEFKLQRREKKKVLKQQRREFIRQAIANGEELPAREKIYKPEEQKLPVAKVLLDCEFDDLMSLKEVISLSSQITRCYALNRRTQQPVKIEISSFNKRLKERFDNDLPQSKLWDQNVHFTEENLETLVTAGQDLSKFVYLSADTEETLDVLEPDMTYIVGGIVDKGRYKNLCLDKAKKLGLSTKRLPIDEFIKLSGRRVLATSHVFELLVKWYELKDWKLLFETVLPERKLLKDDQAQSTDATDVTEA